MTIPAALYYITPQSAEIQITQGDTWTERFDITDENGSAVDLTGLTGSLKIKDTFTGTVLATATVTIPTPASGQVVATLSSATTTGLSLSGASATERTGQIGFYDLQLTDGSSIVTIVGGIVTLYREVTT